MSEETSDIEERKIGAMSLPFYRKPWFMWGMSSALVLLVLLMGFVKLSEYLAGNLIKSKVQNASNGLYVVEFEDIIIDWPNTKIELIDFNYHKARPKDPTDFEYAFVSPYVHIKLSQIWGIYHEQSLHVEKVFIGSPEMDIRQNKKRDKKSNFSLNTGDFYIVIQGFIHSFQIDNFEVSHLHLNYTQTFNKAPLNFEINDLSFSIDNFHVDSSSFAHDSSFFFTEGVQVSLRDQTLNLGDHIHVAHFDSLKLSTRTNNIEVYNFTLHQDSASAAAKNIQNVNHYQLEIPYTGVKGLDFRRAYQENILAIDSVVFNNLRSSSDIASLKRENNKIKIDTSVNNRVVEVLLGWFDEYELKQLHINDAHLAAKYSKNDSAQIQGLHLEFVNFKLDTHDLESTSYYPNFEGMRMLIQNPQFDLPNQQKLHAKQLKFSTFDSSLVIQDVVLTRLDSTFTQDAKIKIDEIKLLGVRPQEIIQSKKLVLQKMIIEHPVLEVVISNDRKRNSTLNLHDFIDHNIQQYAINEVVIRNGEAKLLTPNKRVSLNRVGRFNIHLSKFKLDPAALKKKRFLYSRNATINLQNVKIYDANLQHYLGAQSLSLKTSGGRLIATNFEVKPLVKDSSELQFIAKISVEKLNLSGIDFNHINHLTQVDWYDINLANVDAFVNLLQVHKKDSSDAGIWSQVKTVNLNHINVNNVNLVLQDSGASVIKMSAGFVHAKQLVADTNKLNEGKLVFMTDSIHYGAQRIMAPLHQSGHMLSIEHMDRGFDSTLEISDLSLRPIPGRIIPDSVTKLICYIPKLQVKDFNFMRSRYTDSLMLGSVTLSHPVIKLRLPRVSSGSFKLSSQLPHNFLGGIQTLGVASLVLDNGYISINKKETELAVKQLNLNSANWLISQDTKWEPHKFLLADSFNISLKQLEYKIPGLEFCHNVDSLTFGFERNELRVHGVYYNNWKNSEYDQPNRVSIYLPYINFSKPDLYQYLTDSNIVIDKISTLHGILEGDWFANQPGQKIKLKFPTVAPTLKGVNEVRIHQIEMREMDIQMRLHKGDWISPLEMDKFHLQIDSFHIKSGEAIDSSRILWSDNVQMSVENVYTKVDNGLYELGADELSFSTQSHTLKGRGLNFVPNVNRYEYALHKGRQIDVFNASLHDFEVVDLDFLSLLYQHKVIGGELRINKPSMAVLKDKRIPLGPKKYKNVLPEIFKKLPISISLDSIIVTEMKIRYEEFPENGRQPGVILLKDMNIQAINVTNDTSKLMQNPELRIDMTTKFLDTADLSLHLKYNMLDSLNSFTMSSTLGTFDATQINGFIVPTVSARIHSGKVDRMDMRVMGNDTAAGGKMSLYYDNLKFEFLDAETHKKNKSKSALGTFVIKKKHKYHPVRKRKALFFKRDTSKGWINYLVKLELAGIEGTVVGDKKFKKQLRKMDKALWKEFDKKDKAERKAQQKALRKAEKAGKRTDTRVSKE